MFKKNKHGMARNQDGENPAYNLIDAGTIINGDIQTEGNIRIDGTLTGTITAKGKVVVGETGKIEGEIYCQNADISGTLKAKITVSELLSLKSTANLVGEINTKKLAIEPGADFSGTCSMGAVIKEMSYGESVTEELQSAEATA